MTELRVREAAGPVTGVALAGIAYYVHESSAPLSVHMLLPAEPRWGRRRLRDRALRVELVSLANQNVTALVELLVDISATLSCIAPGKCATATTTY